MDEFKKLLDDSWSYRHVNCPQNGNTIGGSAVMPEDTVPWAAEITIPPNRVQMIGTLAGDTTVTLTPGEAGLANEWIFVVPMPDPVVDLVLPEITWDRGYAPAFGAGTVTEVRLWYRGETLMGVWI